MLNALSTTALWAAAASRCGTAVPGLVLCPIDLGNPTNASTQMVGGKAVFENDNYRISAGDNNEVLIQNKNTGETYRAWGDPHMDIDGKHEFDFWGTTTFLLDDGTKVTIETTPWAGNPNATISSKVTISNGDYGVQITGVDTNTLGDLAIDEGKGWGGLVDLAVDVGMGWGGLVDLAVDDGNVLVENTFGKGFLAMDNQGRIRQVDQQYINETDLLKGGALQQQFQGAFSALEGLLAITFVGAFLGSLGSLLNSGSDDNSTRRAAPGLLDVLRPTTGDLGPALFNWTLNR